MIGNIGCVSHTGCVYSYCSESLQDAIDEYPPTSSCSIGVNIANFVCLFKADKGVNKIIQTCPRLRNLILAKCRLITDAAVEAITKLGKNLHYIHLGHCARITDVSVKALAKFCNRISYIDLACCSNLTDESVVELAGQL